jgi:hypothetical protein
MVAGLQGCRVGPDLGCGARGCGARVCVRLQGGSVHRVADGRDADLRVA